MNWRGGGFFFVCVHVCNPTNQFFASLSLETTTAYVVGCEQQQHDRTETHTCWANEWQTRLPHRAPIDDIITKLLVAPPVSCSQSCSVCVYCGSFTDVTPAAYFLRLFNLLGSTCELNVFSLEIRLILTAQPTMVMFMVFRQRSILYSINTCWFTFPVLRLQTLPKKLRWNACKYTVNFDVMTPSKQQVPLNVTIKRNRHYPNISLQRCCLKFSCKGKLNSARLWF